MSEVKGDGIKHDYFKQEFKSESGKEKQATYLDSDSEIKDTLSFCCLNISKLGSLHETFPLMRGCIKA